MSLAPGTRLGPYEILAKLGEGGMGDVYKAKDTRLDRTVAIKIVRTDFSERFEREAKSISALNHPNICTLHDVGRLRPEGASASQGDEVSYLVMEFVDGAPISGPLPIADVLKYGAQICDALEAAHRKSIVHRDLKPANIMATKSGIKLLDFGLAKLQPGAAGAPGNDATVAALTGAHTIIGTPQYMAPEQIEGHEADARTDIFALGCVLYELITGKRAFEGKTASSVMAAILATEPRKISELAPVTPPALEWVITRCLEKDPDARWQSARDVALQLKWVADQPAPAIGAGPAGAPRRAMLTGLVAGIAIMGIVAAAWIWTSSGSSGNTSATAPGHVSLSARLPGNVALLMTGRRPAIALSPDGRTIAFGGDSDGQAPAIYLRPVDSFDAVKIAGTEGGTSPFFSPSGQWIAFVGGGQLRKIPVEGGAPVVICDANQLRGAVWLDDDTIVLTPSATGPLMRVSAQTGATPTPLTKLDASQHEKTHRSPMVLPGGKVVVFVIGSNEIGTYDESRIVALTLDSGHLTELVKGGHSPAYSPTGHLLYVRDSTLFAVPFDVATLKLSGSPLQVLKDVTTLPSYGTAEYAVASSGALIYAPGGSRSRPVPIKRVNKTGKIEPLLAPEWDYTQVEMSHDGRRLALVVTGANNVLWAYDIERNQMTRLTLRFDVESPVWNSNNSRVTYWSGAEVRSVVADSSGSDDVLISSAVAAGRMILPESWSDDGQTLAVTVITPGKGADVGLYSVKDKNLNMTVASRFEEYGGRLSPDGKWLAFVSEDSTRAEVYVRAVDGSAKYPVSNQGSDWVRWSAHGRELIMPSPQGWLRVSFTPGTPPSFGQPELLVGPTTNAVLKDVFTMAPSPDGTWYAMLFDVPLKPLTEIRVVTNWTQTK